MDGQRRGLAGRKLLTPFGGPQESVGVSAVGFMICPFLDIEFLRKVEAMQDSLAAANGPRCGSWRLRSS